MRVKKESERAGIKLNIKNHIKYQIFEKHLSIKKYEDQLEHVEDHGSCTVEVWLGEF